MHARRRVASLALLLAPALAFLPRSSTGAASTPKAGPDSRQQPLVDGCQRAQLVLIAGDSTPEWVYVRSADVQAARLGGDVNAGDRTLHGTVRWSRPPGEDLYISHDFNDANFSVTPDPADADLLATGNLNDKGESHGTLEIEWESTKYPTWAWPQSGDRVVVRGAWIWDCGHWGGGIDDTHGISPLLPGDPYETLKDQVSGGLRGEQTEIHPPTSVAVQRKDYAADGRNAARLDVWVNGDGAAARSLEDCALNGVYSGLAARAACTAVRDVGGDYSYALDPGPAPSNRSRLVVDAVEVHPETDAALRSTPVSAVQLVDARDVAVHFTLPHSPAAQHFGISVTAHWSDAPAAVRHEITLEQVTIHRDLDGASESNTNPTGQEREQTPSPGEWVLYAAANGRWAQLPRISEVRDGQVTPLGLLWSYWLPRGVPPRLFVGGRECDEPILDCRAEQYAATSADQQPSTELGFNDRPGRVQISDGSHLGVPMSRGRQTYRPTVAAVGHNNEDQSDPTCGAPCYSVTATLRSASAPGVDLDGGTGPGTGGAGDGGSGGGGLAGTGGLALGVAAVATTAAALGIRRLGRGLRGPAARP